MVLLSVTGAVLAYVTSLRKLIRLLWLPLVYVYWIVEAFIATYSLAKIVLKRPRKWRKTVKTGVVTSSS
jgi:hypothetical protein